jgi:hypothetical protein
VYACNPGKLRKTLFRPDAQAASDQLCGSGAALAPDNRHTDSAYGWRYIDGPIHCLAGGQRQHSYQAADFRDRADIALGDGWNGVEIKGAPWNGAWSQGARSRLVLTLPAGEQTAALSLVGQYLDGNRRTHVWIDGVDRGWQQLDRPVLLPLPAARGGAALTIELEHEAPRSPGSGDPRALAFFLREVNLRTGP